MREQRPIAFSAQRGGFRASAATDKWHARAAASASSPLLANRPLALRALPARQPCPLVWPPRRPHATCSALPARRFRRESAARAQTARRSAASLGFASRGVRQRETRTVCLALKGSTLLMRLFRLRALAALRPTRAATRAFPRAAAARLPSLALPTGIHRAQPRETRSAAVQRAFFPTR